MEVCELQTIVNLYKNVGETFVTVRPAFRASPHGKASQLRPQGCRDRRHTFHHQRQAKHLR